MQILKSTPPKNSELLNLGINYDYIDSFQGVINDPQNIVTPKLVGKSFFTSSPKWIEKLFSIRNKIVGVLGLKTSGEIKNREELLMQFKCETGEQLGLFKVFESNQNEVILGEDDKHLNFRISLFILPDTDIQKKNIIITTTVKFNNQFGKLYFLPVKPFHKIIAPKMLKGIIKTIEAS